jgi:hypothetical protein
LVPGVIGPAKLSLYIGTDPVKPSAQLITHKVWLLGSRDEWTRFNETAEALGLVPPNTYYWQIAQQIPGQGRVLSEVGAIHVRDYDAQGRLHFRVRAHRPNYDHDEEVRVLLEIHNTSDRPAYLTFPQGQLFYVDVYFVMNWLPDERLVWSTPLAFPFNTLTIPRKEIYKNEFVWRQVDNNEHPVGSGIYEARVRCTAREFSRLAKAAFIIG